jgi:hypothetical protein
MILQQFNGQRVHVLAKTMHREEKVMQGSERNEQDANAKSKGKSAANTKSKGKSAKSAQTCLEAKCRGPRTGQAFGVSLRSRNAHGHLTRAILRENLEDKCRGADGAAP